LAKPENLRIYADVCKNINQAAKAVLKITAGITLKWVMPAFLQFGIVAVF